MPAAILPLLLSLLLLLWPQNENILLNKNVKTRAHHTQGCRDDGIYVMHIDFFLFVSDLTFDY